MLLRTVVSRQLLSNLWGAVLKGKGGVRTYGFCWGKKKPTYVDKHQNITSSHKKQTNQVIDFHVFLCMERSKIWAHCNHSFDVHPHSLWPVSSFPPSGIPFKTHCQWQLQWLLVWRQASNIPSLTTLLGLFHMTNLCTVILWATT